MKPIYCAALFAAILLFFSCNRNNEKPDTDRGVSVAALKREPATTGNTGSANAWDKELFQVGLDSIGTPPQEPGDHKKQQQQETSPKAAKPDWDKKIIKKASLNAEVKDYKVFYASIREKVRAVGGYIAQEEQTQSEYKIENSLVIKVPVDQFDEAVAQLSANTEKINEKKITSQDVTTEMVDTRSRMEAKKQVRLRYLDLLKQAKNMEEILSVQSEINAIQEQIESATGRIDYLGHEAVFSTISLTYFQVLNGAAKKDDDPSFATRLGSAFSIGWDWIRELLVGIIAIWPLLLAGLAAFVIYKRTRAKKVKPVG